MTDRKYQIEFTESAEKELADIPKHYRQKIISKINKLHFEPRPQNAKKLKGADKLYRLRHSDYRVVYRIWDKKLVIVIIRAAHRKDVYRNL